MLVLEVDGDVVFSDGWRVLTAGPCARIKSWMGMLVSPVSDQTILPFQVCNSWCTEAVCTCIGVALCVSPQCVEQDHYQLKILRCSTLTHGKHVWQSYMLLVLVSYSEVVRFARYGVIFVGTCFSCRFRGDGSCQGAFLCGCGRVQNAR